jgi:predicted Zn-dependent protease with MMP-like domain
MVKRRRGSRTAPLRHRRHHVPFEWLVEEALDAIPPPFSEALNEVAILIADEPTEEQLGEWAEPGSSLYGIYEGVARSEWGADWAPVANRITLFRLPLEADFPDPDDLAEEVRITVIHELAHHLGIDDARLTELGVD